MAHHVDAHPEQLGIHRSADWPARSLEVDFGDGTEIRTLVFDVEVAERRNPVHRREMRYVNGVLEDFLGMRAKDPARLFRCVEFEGSVVGFGNLGQLPFRLAAVFDVPDEDYPGALDGGPRPSFAIRLGPLA